MQIYALAVVWSAVAASMFALVLWAPIRPLAAYVGWFAEWPLMGD